MELSFAQGTSIEDARANLIGALSLFFESAAPTEITRRLHSEVFVKQVEVPIGGAYALVTRRVAIQAAHPVGEARP